MSAAGLLEAERFLLPRSLAVDSLTAISRKGRRDEELFIALAGVIEGGAVHIRRGVLPRQTAHKTRDGLLVTIDGAAIFELNRDCYEHGDILVAQIHGHPGRAYHSGADDKLAMVRLPGGLSIVVPNFGAGAPSAGRWSVNRLRRDGIWAPAPNVLELT